MNAKRGVVTLTLVTMLWGTTFPAIKVIMKLLDATSYAGYRSMIAALAMLPLIGKKAFENDRVLKGGIILGLLYFTGLALQAWGIKYTTASSAAFITSFNVPLVCLLEVLILRRRPSRELLISMMMAVLGVLLLSLEPGSYRLSYGDIIVLACTIFWALQVIFIDRYSRECSVIPLAFMQLMISGVVGIALSASLGEPVRLDFSSWILLAYLAVVCSSLTCVLQIYGQRYTTSTQAAIIYTLEPVFASAFSSILLGEILTARQYAGAMLIVVATYMASKA